MADGNRPKTLKRIVLSSFAALLLLCATWCCWNPTAHLAPRTSPEFDKRPTNDAFADAASEGNLPKLNQLLGAGVDPNSGSKGEEGSSALSLAASNGNISAVR